MDLMGYSKKILGKSLTYLLRLVKAPTQIAFILGIILASGYYILEVDPYISVPGNSFSFELPVFNTCNVTFKTPTKVISYGISRVKAYSSAETGSETTITTTTVGTDVSKLVITNNYKNDLNSLAQLNVESNRLLNYRILVITGDSLSSEVSSVETNGVEIEIAAFKKNNLKNKAQLEKYRYIRKQLADTLVAINDMVSNWVLTIMFVGIIPLTIKLVKMEINDHLPENLFKKNLFKKLNITEQQSKQIKHREIAYAKSAADWFSLNNTFRFLQVLGPAVGFILTVSSLVASLNPSVHAANGIDGFITGIHVAMISTFTGLLLRLIALEASRVNDSIFNRIEIHLGNHKSE